MIPFISAQFERGSGTVAQEVLPVVPSIFEPLPSPLFPRVDAADQVELHSPPATASSPGSEQPPESPRRADFHASPNVTPASAHAADPFNTPPVRSVIPSIHEMQSHSRSTNAIVDTIPLRSGLVSQLAPPERVEIARDHLRPESPTEPTFREAPVRPTPLPPLDAIHARIDDLTHRWKLSARPPAISPIASIVPPHVPDIKASESTLRKGSSPPLTQEQRHPTGILPQQPVPQIPPVNTPAPAPVVTVSIGRIEFRNSARRNDSLPQPATPSPKPESRVLSLEDYLRHRSTGGT